MSTSFLLALALFAAAAAFALVVGAWRTAMAQQGPAPPLPAGMEPRVSVVVPARDEEHGIVPLLQDLYMQRYPRESLEVIVVDDGSRDRTAELARGMQPRWPQLKVLRSAGEGKKAAIATGVEAAQGELIVLTDADARCGPARIGALAAQWVASGRGMLVAPVRTTGHGALGALQEMEQDALLGAALGSASAGRPFLAYGANLAFSRSAFMAVGGYAGDRYASGDDVFLLQRMRRAGHRIGAIADAAALVTVEAERAWAGFVRQRLRWAGKMRGAGPAAVAPAVLALLLPWALLWSSLRFDFVAQMGGHALYTAALLGAAWLCWLVPSVGLANDARRMLGLRPRPLMAVAALALFTAYAPAIAVLALAIRPRWKGRRVR